MSQFLSARKRTADMRNPFNVRQAQRAMSSRALLVIFASLAIAALASCGAALTAMPEISCRVGKL